MESIFGRSVGDVEIAPNQVHEVLARHVLTDGFKIVYDTKASHGSWIVDARTGEEYLDLYTFFASAPLGSNPRGLADDPEFLAVLAEAAANKPANPDMYTTHYAQFVETFDRVLGDRALPHLFFVEGGALAVENALKTRVRLEEPAQRGGGPLAPARHQGDAPDPGVPRPVRVHPVADQHRAGQDRPVPEVRLAQDRRARGHVPGPGAPGRDRGGRGAGAGPGRPRPSRPTRTTSPASSPSRSRARAATTTCGRSSCGRCRSCAMPTTRCSCSTRCRPGSGITGTAWAYQQLGLEPDIVAFAKKVQLGGVMAGRRVNEVPRQRVRGLRPDQLDLGWRAGRHGPLPAAPGDHRAGRADRPRGQDRRLAARRAAGPRRAAPAPWRRTSAGAG